MPLVTDTGMMGLFNKAKDKVSEYDPGTTVYMLVEELKRYLDE